MDPQNIELLKEEKECRITYLNIIKSSLSLMKCQSKLEWLNDGDSGTRFFFTKLRQRKQRNYVYSINHEKGDKVEGFQEVAQVMTDYYQKLLGKQKTKGSLPFRYLGVPITAGKVSKLECTMLVEKISKRRPTLVAWQDVCIPKKNGGLGLKNLKIWNKACIAKLVWAVARKKDLMLGGYMEDISKTHPGRSLSPQWMHASI
ncbi:LOW QUALITY PROTEIN: hypothetical protein Cgig2_025984 [Carnegiea gigantea]|uniref:Uncharacterized protein n=1 Tax=Carnegiea gigantea TaxID=171969 RepID=A0A9Q1GMV3_9CARY|nr:LOW QUALITY PROTEIN: hypothetical protein Cgig2_025984 [Carnegiea gigantea]